MGGGQPDRAALAFADRSWTWAELDKRIRQAAGALRAAGIGPGDRFAVLDKNHPACIELTLAASLIGAVNAVVNHRLAPEELEYVLSDSSARLVVVGSEFAAVLGEARETAVETVIGIDSYEKWIGAADPVSVPYESGDDDCFLQLYTSGTTGRPKGAMLTQRSMCAHTTSVGPAYEMDEDSVNVVAMPLFHVGGTSWALGSMYAGGHTVIVREVVPAAILDLIEAERATHAFFVPAVIQMLVADEDRAQAALRSLAVLGYGGSPMPAPLMDKVVQTLPTPLYSVYGMTEMSGVFCVLGPADHRDSDRPHRRASAGRPLPGTEVRIVDPVTGQNAKAGATGEFWVRSDQIMGGYWRKPEQTAETLLPGGWLRTGDAGRIDADGYLYIEDRVKDMVITGGENVYPAEVERVLHQHPVVAEVAVIGVPDPKWGETVKAVVVPVGDGLAAAELIAFARERLAHYKCPTSVDFVEALPRNPTGKILKRELRLRLA
ncbi:MULTISPECIES: long-chain fatty acid--CoA ligase [unclassified Pseudonocardia]|uniref:acyl-CoA synthetase n=1 Tax=unclassified Pseudonocardia TaxID=2619320 RepID=UPI0001FFE9C7|nr:long-chain fatty acid--CoA ligase [Pseudonocardia sp. Ae707_Ps1]OLM09033.1 O-succinylbenzoic acid--CoA ligase [Pseudonocardia sp. Ae707_Ps1]